MTVNECFLRSFDFHYLINKDCYQSLTLRDLFKNVGDKSRAFGNDETQDIKFKLSLLAKASAGS